MNSEETIIKDENTVMEETQLDNVSKTVAEATSKKASSALKKGLAAGSGVVLGGASGVAASAAGASDETPDEVIEEPVAGEEQLDENVGQTQEVSADQGIDYAESVNDEMSFSQAFAAARAEVGSGGAFEWRGNVYNTFTAEEWAAMTPEEKEEFGSHFTGESSSDDIIPDEDVSLADEFADDPVEMIGEIAGDSVMNVTPEVEILGVIEGEDTGALFGAMNVGDLDVVLVDFESDGYFDEMYVDHNHDGELADNEIYDISDQNIEVEQFAVNSFGDNALYAMDDGTLDYTDDADMGDYDFA